MKLTVDEASQLAARALKKAGASKAASEAAARALVAAEMEGLTGHGLSRVALYAQHLRQGRANGRAKPKVIKKKGATCLVDANGGLAFLASALAAKEAAKRAKRYGVAFSGVTNSHHFGAAAYHLAPLAEAGLIGLAFTNSPAAINAWGGSKAFFGTNPIAAIFPRRNAPAIVVDPSLTGAAFSFENDSYFEPGNAPRIGHAILAIDPDALAGASAYFSRLEVMISKLLADGGVRLPGARRQQAAAKALAEGLEIPDALASELRQLARSKK